MLIQRITIETFKGVCLNSKFRLLVLVALVIGQSLNAMNKQEKAAGALQVVAGAAVALKCADVGFGIWNRIGIFVGPAAGSLGPYGLGVGLGLGLVAHGVERLCKKGEIKIESGQVVIQYKDPNTGEMLHQRFKGADVTDIDKFLSNNGFIISWRANYPLQKITDASIQTINDEVKPLQQQFGAAVLYGNIYNINHAELRDAYAQAIENPLGIDTLANELAQNENLFLALRRLAIHSWGTPDHKDNRALFIKATSHAIAKLMLATRSAHTYSYEDLVRTLRAEKEAVQVEFRAGQAAKDQVDAQLAQAQQRVRRIQEEATAQKFEIYREAAESEEHALDLALEECNGILVEEEERFEQLNDALNAEQAAKIGLQARLTQTKTFLEEADREVIAKEEANEVILESYRDRVVRLNEHKNRTISDAVAQSCDIETQRADLEEQMGHTRNVLQQATQKLINERAQNALLQGQLVILKAQLAQARGATVQAEQKTRRKSQK